jgi:hypothetical protein
MRKHIGGKGIVSYQSGQELTTQKRNAMKLSQNSLFKADTSTRSVAESGILELVHAILLTKYDGA